MRRAEKKTYGLASINWRQFNLRTQTVGAEVGGNTIPQLPIGPKIDPFGLSFFFRVYGCSHGVGPSMASPWGVAPPATRAARFLIHNPKIVRDATGPEP